MRQDLDTHIAPFSVWCPKREVDEPAYAFLARNVERNIAQSPNSLYGSIGHRGSHISRISTKLISRLTHRDHDDIADASFIDGSDEDISTIFGERLARSQCTVSTRKWCSRCLSDGRHHKLVWDLDAVTCCSQHNVPLSKECDCGRSVHWRNSFICIAACGCELDNVEAPIRTVSMSERAFCAYVGGRLRASPRIQNVLLDELDLNVIIRVVENLGRFRLSPSKTLKTTYNAFSRAEVTAAGYAVILDTHGEYNALLNAVLNDDRIGDFAKWGLHAAYGEFRQWVSDLADNSALKAKLYDGMLRHAEFNQIVVSKRATNSDGTRIKIDRFTLQEAATYCRVAHKRLKEVAVNLGYIPANTRSGAPVELRRVQVEEIARRLKNRINKKELAEQLCIDRHAIERMRKAGLIKCFGEEMDLQVNRQGSQVWNSYSADIAERFIAEIDATLKPGDQEDLSDIPIAAKNLRCSVQRIIGYLKDGRLHLRKIDEDAHGLKRHLISRSELRRLDSNDHPDGMSLRQANKELGFQPSTLWTMRKHCLIETVSTPGSHKISTDEIERVRSTFMVSNEIIETYDVPKQPRAVTKLLQLLGIKPFLAGDDVHQQVYLRADVHRVLKSYKQRVVSISIDKPLPLAEARKALYIPSPNFCGALIKGGYLKAEAHGKCKIIAKEEMQQFRALYVTTAELVEKLKVGRSHKAVEEMKKCGVAPICTLASHKGIMFLREDVKKAGFNI